MRPWNPCLRQRQPQPQPTAVAIQMTYAERTCVCLVSTVHVRVTNMRLLDTKSRRRRPEHNGIYHVKISRFSHRHLDRTLGAKSMNDVAICW